MSDRLEQPLRLVVVSPEQVAYDGEVHWVQVPLLDGLIGIWPGHAPLIAAVAGGKLRFQSDEGVQEMRISEGVLRVARGACVLLVRPGADQMPAYAREGLADDLQEALGEVLTPDEIQALQDE